MENICRLCLSVTSNTMCDLSDIIFYKLRTTLGIQPTDEKLFPQQICIQCSTKINDAWEFHQLVGHNENILLNYLNNGVESLTNFYNNLKSNLNHKTEVDLTEFISTDTVTDFKHVSFKDVKLECDDDIDDDDDHEEIFTEDIKSESFERTEMKTQETDKSKEIVPTHNYYETNKCLTCFETFESQKCLISHYHEKHIRGATQIKLSVRKGMYTEEREGGKRQYKCKTCEKILFDPRSIQRHVISHISNRPRPLLCKLCGRSYTNVTKFIYHARVHNNEKFYCKHGCGFNSSYKGAVAEHEKRHESTAKYKCETCGKGFTVRTWFEQHQNVHSGVKPFVCQHCGIAFHMSKNLQAHCSLKHPQMSQVKRIVCIHCSLPCDCTRALRQHMETVHGIKSSSFLCDKCGQSFNSAHQLNSHKQVHNGVRPFVCSVCNKSFAKKYNLENHEKIHNSEKNEICPLCAREFVHRKSMLRHIKRVHKRTEVPKRRRNVRSALNMELDLTSTAKISI